LIEERKQPRVAALPLKEPRRFRPELALAAQRLASKHPPRSVAAEGGLALCHACDRRATPTPSRAEWPAGQAGDRRISAYLSLGAAFLNGNPFRRKRRAAMGTSQERIVGAGVGSRRFGASLHVGGAAGPWALDACSIKGGGA
jgi:hypothetical protein